MNEQLELRLRRDLSSMDAVPLDDVARVERAITAATERRRRRRRRRAGLIGVSGTLVIASGLAIWSRGDQPDEVSTIDSVVSVVTSAPTPSATLGPVESSPPSSTPDASDGWEPIAADPRGPVLYPSVVWAGDVAIVFGGQHPAGYAVGGAVGYSPSSDSWETLADPPAEMNSSGRVNVLVLWTGQEVLAFGGESLDGATLYADGAAVDPVANVWRSTAAPPRPLSSRSPWAWTGTEVFVWPPGDSGLTGAPLAYAPATDTWRELPLPPVSGRQRSASVWTGDEWLVWGGSADGDDFADGAAYSPTSGAWRMMASSPLSPRRVNAAWTGSEMILAAGSSGGDPVTGNGEMAYGDGAAYDPRTDTWRSIALGPGHPGFEPVWTGEQLLMFAKGGVVRYDAGLDRWEDECCGGSPAMTSSKPVWTGTQALLFGSIDPSIGGATYTPPAVDEPATEPPSEAPASTELLRPGQDTLATALEELGVSLDVAPADAVTLGDEVLCGVEDLDLEQLLAPDGLDDTSRRCFLDRHISGQPAVFVEAFPTTEGDPVVIVWRTRPDGTIEQHVDATRDNFGSGTWQLTMCGRLTTSSPNHPIATQPTLFTCDEASVETVGRLTTPSAPVPIWFEQREELPFCGYEIRTTDRDLARRSCFAEAVRAGARAEYAHVLTGDQGLRVASWFRSLGDGTFEIVEWSAGLVAGRLTLPSEWRRWSCTTIVFATDPGGQVDGLPLVNDGGECTPADAWSP